MKLSIFRVHIDNKKAGFHYTRLPCTRKTFSYAQQHGIAVNRVVTDPNQPITAKDLYARTRIRV